MTVYIMDSLYFESISKIIPAEFAKGFKMILFYEKGRALPDCVFEYISKGWITLKLLPSKMQDCIPIVTFELGMQHSMHPENKFILWGDAALTEVFKFFLVYDDNASSYLGIRNILKDQAEVQEKYPDEQKDQKKKVSENNEDKSSTTYKKTASNKRNSSNKEDSMNKKAGSEKENRNNKQKKTSKTVNEKRSSKVKNTPSLMTDETKRAATSEMYDAFSSLDFDDDDVAVLASPSVPAEDKKNSDKAESETARAHHQDAGQKNRKDIPVAKHSVNDVPKKKTDEEKQYKNTTADSGMNKKDIKKAENSPGSSTSSNKGGNSRTKETALAITGDSSGSETLSSENTVKVNNDISAGADLETALKEFLQEECFENFPVSNDEMRSVIMSILVSVDASNIKAGMHLYKEYLEQFLPEKRAKILYDKTIPVFQTIVNYFSNGNQ